jgi:hypothetical protein
MLWSEVSATRSSKGISLKSLLVLRSIKLPRKIRISTGAEDIRQDMILTDNPSIH